MKQRGITSFFGGGKPENHAKAVKSTPSAKQEPLEPLEEANSSAYKRSREVINLSLWARSSLCMECTGNPLYLPQDDEPETTAAAVQEAPKSKLKRLRKADITDASVTVSFAPIQHAAPVSLHPHLASDPMLP